MASKNRSKADSKEKYRLFCPNYTKYWISDINCPSGKEDTINDCNINSEFGEHSCDNNDCIYVGCDGEADEV